MFHNHSITSNIIFLLAKNSELPGIYFSCTVIKQEEGMNSGTSIFTLVIPKTLLRPQNFENLHFYADFTTIVIY